MSLKTAWNQANRWQMISLIAIASLIISVGVFLLKILPHLGKCEDWNLNCLPPASPRVVASFVVGLWIFISLGSVIVYAMYRLSGVGGTQSERQVKRIAQKTVWEKIKPQSPGILLGFLIGYFFLAVVILPILAIFQPGDIGSFLDDLYLSRHPLQYHLTNAIVGSLIGYLASHVKGYKRVLVCVLGFVILFVATAIMFTSGAGL